jgi:hypothetical protein
MGGEAWSLTLEEEHRLRVLENKVRRKLSGVKRAEVTGNWRTFHNGELYDLFSSLNIIRVVKSRTMRWLEYASRMGDRRGTYRVLVWKSEGKRPLGRP